MKLSLRNRSNYLGEGRWNWTAYLDDGGSGELEKVERVTYVLHPTFARSVLEVTDPKEGFALQANGWGTFELVAFAQLRSGKKVKLTHELELESEEAAAADRTDEAAKGGAVAGTR